MDNKELYEWMKQNLYTAVVCDILDTLGYRNQAMHQRLRPLDEANCVFAGRARTVRWMEVDYFDPENPYGREIEFMDSLDVYKRQRKSWKPCARTVKEREHIV